MTGPDPVGTSLFFHRASAFGVTGRIDRPLQQAIPTQATVSLSPAGGHGAHRVESYNAADLVSFSTAYVTVGGSLDDTNKCHATYACSVIEDLNIGDILTADKVVSRLSIYHPCEGAHAVQPNFSIFGSYFENLRIAGQKLDIKLTSHPFNNTTYDDIHGGAVDVCRQWAVGYHFAQQLDDEGKIKDERAACALEHNARVVSAAGERFRKWEKTRTPGYTGPYRYSAVNPADLEQALKNSGMTNFGGAISVPRFGVVYLADLIIHQDHRFFTMLRVEMNSPTSGFITGSGTGGGGKPVPPT